MNNSIFDQINHARLKVFFNRAEKIYRDILNLPENKRIQAKIEHRAKLMQDAEECKELFRDGRYAGRKRYLEELREDMMRMFLKINEEDKTRESMVLDSARLAYGISLIDSIQNEPMKVIERLEQLEKEIEEEQKRGHGYEKH